jgi:hypothetical protein
LTNVNLDPLIYIIEDNRIEKPRFLTEIHHWEREKVNDKRWKSKSGIYVMFDIKGNVAYIGTTDPFGDKYTLHPYKYKKQRQESRVKKHFNGTGGTIYWKYYYKVRLYNFTNNSSRDIYEIWWIDNLKPYGNKKGRYYPYKHLLPNSKIHKDNWSGFQKDAFIYRTAPENIALWEYWQEKTGVTTNFNNWVKNDKLEFLKSLSSTNGVGVLKILRDIRKEARKQ